MRPGCTLERLGQMVRVGDDHLFAAPLQEIEGSFRSGRIKALKRSIIITLTLLNTIMYAKGEPMV